jgi:hypothetical protein
MPKPPKDKPRRKRFSGEIREEDDTYKVGEEKIDGLTYHERRDGSVVPKQTSISVTQSTRRIYAILREAGRYNNYDELLLDIALPIVRNKSFPNKPLSLREDIAKSLEHAVTQAKIDRGLRTHARKKAFEKRRYHRRKTSTL